MNDTMEAGRELDALVETHVMGKEVAQALPHFDVGRFAGPNIVTPGGGRLPLPRYSMDIAAAWEVVEKMRGDQFALVVNCMCQGSRGNVPDPDEWMVRFHDVFVEWHETFADTFPLAVCLAALKAVAASPGGPHGAETTP